MLRVRPVGVAAAAIVVFWGVMMALLISREGVFNRAQTPGAGHELPPERDVWMGVFLPGEVHAGFINVRNDPALRQGRAGIETRVLAQLRLEVFQRETRLLVQGTAWSGEQTGLEVFDFTVRSGGTDFRIEAEVAQNEIQATVHTAGAQFPFRAPFNQQLLLGSGVGTSMNVPNLAVGESVTVDLFDPLTLSMGRTRIACTAEAMMEFEGRQVRAREMVVTASGAVTRAWVAPSGELLRAETPMGYTLVRMAPAEAMAGSAGPVTGASPVEMAAVRPTGAPVRDGLARMLVRVAGVPAQRTLPADTIQRHVAERTYEIVRPEPPAGPVALDEAPPHFEAYLRADPFVQADHPAIAGQARAIAGDATDRWEAALRLYEWVHGEIEKVPVVSIPSALEVLESRQGDCNEHTVLFVALARALGVPARIAVGLVWSPELAGFYYHAWPEVYADTWIPMDPTLGQPIADATHVKLLTGGIENWPQLLPFIGALEIEVLEAE